MDVRLIKYACAERDYFRYESYRPDGKLFTLVAAGSFTLREGGAEAEASPFQGVYYRPGGEYRRTAHGVMKLHFFRFESESTVFPSGVVSFLDTDRIKSDIDFLNKLNDIASESESFGYRAHIFEDIVRLYEFERSSAKLTAKPTDSAVAGALHVIDGGLAGAIDISKLADVAGLSYVQFLRRFKSATGLTPVGYIAAARIKKARYLLANTELLVKEIAPLCGFENEYYFSNFYKKRTGTPPSAYRAELERCV